MRAPAAAALLGSKFRFEHMYAMRGLPTPDMHKKVNQYFSSVMKSAAQMRTIRNDLSINPCRLMRALPTFTHTQDAMTAILEPLLA